MGVLNRMSPQLGLANVGFSVALLAGGAKSVAAYITHGVLSGGAVAICGASAALAISSVLPRNKESERFTLMVVVTVNDLFSLPIFGS